jgi:putative transposase
MYLLRDRDGIYGIEFSRRVDGVGIEQVPISAHSPWQNPYVERVIGSIRRECLDHVIVLGQKHLRRALRDYFEYYHSSRTHLGLAKGCPVARSIEPPDARAIIAEPMVGGLHHRYHRQAA